jgi:hypothetical protein
MIKDNLETIMMVAFLLATALSIYKVYVIFEKQAGDGPSIQELEAELSKIIEELIFKHKSDKKDIYQKIYQHNDFDEERHKNFNENRYNKILESLYLKHQVEDFEQLKEKL